MVNTLKCIPSSWLLIMIMFLASCKGGKKDSAPPIPGGAASQVLTVQAMVVKPEKLASDVDVPGSILAYEETEIHPEVSGRIVTLHLPEGGQVNAGDLLAKLYDGDLQAQMRKLDVQLKIAEQTEQRQGELLKIQGISQQDYDLSLLEVQSLKADMDITKESIRKTEIRAPFSGRLGLKNVSPGAYITPATVLTTISQVSQLKIQFNVPERYSSQLKNGMEVHFSIEGNPNLYTANILATETSIEEETRSLTVRALIKNAKGILRPGTFAKVRIVLGEDDKALMVPNTIIVPQGRKKQLFLYKGGKAMMSEVLTGVRDSTNIQILQGVNPGDTVITSAILFLRPGMNVTLGEVK
ncbi:MAG TPA: efflux RND transporter periplasmic adaptor subunit [Saprospiraceae bacterium]|nr:efflux RND transporter periplasmic adaptor subunit [Saprospiraceae bacterium]